MKNPIKENRLVCDYTFATRLLSFANSTTVADAASEDERDSMIKYANELLTYQCLTATDVYEINYLKNMGHYDIKTTPVFVTTDDHEIHDYFSSVELFSCMKEPCRGNQLLVTVLKNKEDIIKLNSKRHYFINKSNCEKHISLHSPTISKKDLENMGLLDDYEFLTQILAV